ncbi:MAG: ParB/RepB/Spo0J family partition protein [Thermoguttaceae bacterium]
MNKEKRLGRGLEALLGQLPGWGGPLPPGQKPTGGPPQESAAAVPAASVPALAPAPAETAEAHQPPVETRLPIDRIQRNPGQPRQEFDVAEMQSLAESIAEHGLLQPVVVRRVQDRYELIAGERRLRAARQAGWTDVPVHLIRADDRQAAELAIIENLQRKDLNPLEKAASFQRYLEQYGSTQEELAARLQLDRSTIANLIRLLELPEAVQESLRRGEITQGHARALLPLGEEREQIEFSARIHKEGLSVRQTEEMVQEMIHAADRGPLGVVGRDGKSSRTRSRQSEHLAALEQEFRAALGMRVKIAHDAKGRGKLTVHFQNHEEFERLREHICGTSRKLPKSQAG